MLGARPLSWNDRLQRVDVESLVRNILFEPTVLVCEPLQVLRLVDLEAAEIGRDRVPEPPSGSLPELLCLVDGGIVFEYNA